MPKTRQDSLHLGQVLREFIVLSVLATTLAAGCDSEPLGVPCPDVAAGELIVTEIRGPQSGNDQYGEWIEIFNASGRTVDLTGLSVVISKLDGSSQGSFLVRAPVSVGADEYVVFGRQFSGTEPPHIDYGYSGDFDSRLFDSAAVTVASCGNQVDIAVYRNLPSQGTLTLNGASPPNADANSDDINWCIDDRADPETLVSGFRGSPGQTNPFCDGSPCTDDNECASSSCNLTETPGTCGDTGS